MEAETMSIASKSLRASAGVVVAYGFVQGAPAARTTTTTVVMTGLVNPRGLAIGPEGAIYVVEAGHGGTGPCAVLRGNSYCLGPSGAVSRLFHGEQESGTIDS